MERDELDTLLSKRAAPPRASSDLAERIIFAAVSAMPHHTHEDHARGWWDDLMAMIAVPHPSVVVAAGIILGLLMGVQAGDGLAVLQQDWSSFLEINEGGWL